MVHNSIILKLAHPLTRRLGSRFVWSRGKRYHIMAKLDPIKIAWIIRQKENGMPNQQIANSMKVSIRWIQKLHSRYRSTGIIPVLKHPGRPKRRITEQEASMVSSAFEKYRCCAVFLEKTIEKFCQNILTPRALALTNWSLSVR
jgi:transposase